MNTYSLLKPFSLFSPTTAATKTFSAIDFPLRGKSERAICVGLDNTIAYCDVLNGKSLFNCGGTDESIAVSYAHVAKFSALDNVIITGTSSYSTEHILLYDLARCSEDRAVHVTSYQLAGVYPVSIAQHPTGSHFAVGFSDGSVCIYDPRFRRAVNRSEKPLPGTPYLTWNQSGSVLAVSSDNVVSLLAEESFSTSLPFMAFDTVPKVGGNQYQDLKIRTMEFSPNSEDHILINFDQSGFAVWDTNQTDTLWAYKLNLDWTIKRTPLQSYAPILNKTATWTNYGSQIVALSPSSAASQYEIFDLDFIDCNVDLVKAANPIAVNPAGDDKVATALKDLGSQWVSVASSTRDNIFACGAAGVVSFIQNKK